MKNKANEWETCTNETVTEEELFKEWICLRTQFQLKFATKSQENYRNQLIATLNESKKKLLESGQAVLKVRGTEIVLKANKGISGIGKNAKVSAALQQTRQTDAGSKNQEKKELSQFECLNFELVAGDEATENCLNAAFTSECDLCIPFDQCAISYHFRFYRFHNRSRFRADNDRVSCVSTSS